MRRRFRRRLAFNFKDVYYKPRGVPLRGLDDVEISHEEMETLRLRYVEKMKQEDAAKKMGISQSQYQRDIVTAMTKIVRALINRDAIRINDQSSNLSKLNQNEGSDNSGLEGNK